MDALISVIVPVYDVEKYLTKCLDSIVAQTYKNLEILLIDDGSTDRSGKICDEFAAKDDRIKVIHKVNGGVSSARNLGMEICTGAYILFADADDYMTEHAVRCLYDRLTADGTDLAIGHKIRVFENGERVGSRETRPKDCVITKEQAISTLGTDEELSCCFHAKLFDREILKDIVLPPIRYGEDAWIFPHILENCETISVVSELVYFYVQRQGSAIRTTDDEILLESIQALLHVAEFLEDRDLKQNALMYYRGTVSRAMRVKDRKRAREMILPRIDKETRRQVLGKDIRMLVSWISLWCPFVYTWAKYLFGVIRGKECKYDGAA